MAKTVPLRDTIRPRGEVWRVSASVPSSPSSGKSSSGLHRTCHPDVPWPRSRDRGRVTSPSRSVAKVRLTGTAMACTGPAVTDASRPSGAPLEVAAVLEADALGVVVSLAAGDAVVAGAAGRSCGGSTAGCGSPLIVSRLVTPTSVANWRCKLVKRSRLKRARSSGARRSHIASKLPAFQAARYFCAVTVAAVAAGVGTGVG